MVYCSTASAVENRFRKIKKQIAEAEIAGPDDGGVNGVGATTNGGGVKAAATTKAKAPRKRKQDIANGEGGDEKENGEKKKITKKVKKAAKTEEADGEVDGDVDGGDGVEDGEEEA